MATILPDLTLLDRVKQGDEQAFSQLCTDSQTWLARIVRKYYLPGGNKEDLMQMARIGLWQAALTYDPQRLGEFRPWAYVVIKRRLNEAIREANSHKNMVLTSARSLQAKVFNDSEIFTLEDTIPSTESCPEGIFEDDEQVFIVLNIMAEVLSASEWRILAAEMANNSITQTAADTGFNFKQVDNALQRIRRKARAALNFTE